MKLKLPAGSFRAYLFDCDGTIADSMPLHYIAWKKALGEWGCTFDEELFYTWGGKPAAEIIATLNEMNGLKMPVEAVAERKEGLYFEQLPQLKAVPEVLETHRGPARTDSLRRGFRRQAHLNCEFADDARPDGQIRRHRGRGRLPEQQARSRRISDCGSPARGCRAGLPGI